MNIVQAIMRRKEENFIGDIFSLDILKQIYQAKKGTSSFVKWFLRNVKAFGSEKSSDIKDYDGLLFRIEKCEGKKIDCNSKFETMKDIRVSMKDLDTEEVLMDINVTRFPVKDGLYNYAARKMYGKRHFFIQSPEREEGQGIIASQSKFSPKIKRKVSIEVLPIWTEA